MVELNPWILAGLPLVGTIVGGLLSWLVQARADARRDTAAKEAEERAMKLARIERKRTHLTALHERAGNDVAEIRQRQSKSEDAEKLEWTEVLDEVLVLAEERHGRAGALIALVDDESVRQRADELYELWKRYIVTERDTILNGAVPKDVRTTGETAMAGLKDLTTAVRKQLAALNDQEAALFADT